MSVPTPAIQLENLTYAYGRSEAVRDLNLTVKPGRCYGLFGRNGAGKTTTMKCLLNLLRPQRGKARVFGMDPNNDEVAVKRRLAYVPDQVAFYPWMSVRETLDYLASFRQQWNTRTETELLERFRLDPTKKTSALSKGQKTQVALIAAVCPETDLLVLDEPTSGLDPIVRREFIETVIGAYQEGNPGQRTILVSTHLIAEFEGLIDEFTLMTHLLFGPAFLQQFGVMFYGSSGISSLAIFPLLTFVAFWCATGMNGTVRAAFWCLPVAAVVLVAYGFGVSTGMGRTAVEIVRTLTQAVHPFPFSSEFEVMSSKLMWSPGRVVVPALWLIAWLLPLAAIQSYRLFRSEVREGMRPLIRQALVLMGIGFLSGFLQFVPAAATRTMHQNTAEALMGISRGVTAMEIDPAAVSESGYTVSLKAVSNSVALSDRTRSWFATDMLVIRPKGAVLRDTAFEPLQEARYVITAELHGGWKCAFVDNLFTDRYGEGPNRIPRGANYLFVCRSKDGKLGWLDATP